MQDPQKLLQQAFQALLRGDTAERDRLCALAKNAMDPRAAVQKTKEKGITLEQGTDGVYRPKH